MDGVTLRGAVTNGVVADASGAGNLCEQMSVQSIIKECLK
jgi:hypothetical protein